MAEEAPTPSKLGMNERRCLFEKKAQEAIARTNSLGAKGATVGHDQSECVPKGDGVAEPEKAMSLKERMALLQGGGGNAPGVDGKTTDTGTARLAFKSPPPPPASASVCKTSPPADAGVGVSGQTKVGGLHDRLKAFGGGAESQSKPDTAKPPASKPFVQQPAQQQQQQEAGEKPQSISERMAALHGGGGAVDAQSTVAGAAPVIGKLQKSTGNSSMTEPQHPAEAAKAATPAIAPPAAPAPAESAMSLKERLALLQPQEKREEAKPDEGKARKLDMMNARNTNRSGQENLPGNAHNNITQMSHVRNTANFRNSTGSMGSSGGQEEERRESSSSNSNVPKAPRTASLVNVHARWEAPGLSQQAREVAAALGGMQDEEEEKEEAEAPAGELQVKSVFGRVSMFETGDMAAGWDADRAEPGRLPGQSKKEEKVDQTSLDVNDIKNRWKTGNVQAEDKTKKSASEDALFRCHVAASSRTGGVASIQNRMKQLAEGKQPTTTSPKQVTKVQEIAEQIHFDPNTMMPGAQHPSLNYNATESSLRASEWRNFAQHQPGYGGLGDDDDELPPPNAMAERSGDAQSIGEKMRLLKERAALPIEDRMAASTLTASTLTAPGISRPSQSHKNKVSASYLLEKKGLM